MKSLQEHLNESLVTEAIKVEFYNLGFDENGDEVLAIYDDRGNPLKFDEKWMDKLMKKYNGWYNEKFVNAVFDEMPEADQISIEYIRNNDDNEQRLYILRDEIDKGWQDA
jgi:CRISPR/Cas system endoribonuclease Cas6 (RAMP superfamily)